MSETPHLSFAEYPYRYACADSSAGRLLVVMTERGVVDVVSGERTTQMLAAAKLRHPGAVFADDCGVHAEWVAAIVRRIDTPGARAEVPYDLGLPEMRRAAV